MHKNKHYLKLYLLTVSLVQSSVAISMLQDRGRAYFICKMTNRKRNWCVVVGLTTWRFEKQWNAQRFCEEKRPFLNFVIIIIGKLIVNIFKSKVLIINLKETVQMWAIYWLRIDDFLITKEIKSGLKRA